MGGSVRGDRKVSFFIWGFNPFSGLTDFRSHPSAFPTQLYQSGK